MTEDWTLPGWAVLVALAALVLLCVSLGALLLASRRRTRAAVATALGENAALRRELEELARRFETRTAPGGQRNPEPTEATADATPPYVITGVGAGSGANADGAGDPGRTAPRLGAPLFADLVLRESVVQAASLVHGVRRALSPETRNRIRFEVRREVKRSRRQRRAELKQARRAQQAEQRATMVAGDAGTAS